MLLLFMVHGLLVGFCCWGLSLLGLLFVVYRLFYLSFVVCAVLYCVLFVVRCVAVGCLLIVACSMCGVVWCVWIGG